MLTQHLTERQFDALLYLVGQFEAQDPRALERRSILASELASAGYSERLFWSLNRKNPALVYLTNMANVLTFGPTEAGINLAHQERQRREAAALPSMRLDNAASPYGSDMGRRDWLPADKSAAVKLRLVKLRWVDSDYDQGGAYWGRDRAGRESIYHAQGYHDGEAVRLFVRATSRDDAKQQIRALLPNARFYR